MANVATTVLRDSADGLLLGTFLFPVAVYILFTSYLVTSVLKQGLPGGISVFIAGFGLLMLHLTAGVYIIPTGWLDYMPYGTWLALIIFCDLFLVLAAGFIPWGIRRWLIQRGARRKP